jgi:hypothetical protein
MDPLYLQIFLLVNVFLVGVLTAIAIQHARAHFRPKPKQDIKPNLPPVAPVELPKEVKENLIHEAQANFLAVLNSSIGELQHDLRATATQLNKQLGDLGSEVAISERARYLSMLEDLRKQTEAAMLAAQAEIAKHQTELKQHLTEEETKLKTKLAEDIAAEQQWLIKQIDTKLADAVGAFLIETLQHNVDLGTQKAYLTAQLEEHKADFKREVEGEAPTAK